MQLNNQLSHSNLVMNRAEMKFPLTKPDSRNQNKRVRREVEWEYPNKCLATSIKRIQLN